MPLGDLMAALISKGQGRWPLAYLPWPHFIWQDMVADQLEVNLPNRIDQRKGEDNMATARTKRKHSQIRWESKQRDSCIEGFDRGEITLII